MPYIGKEPEHGNYQLLDALTLPDGVFNGSRTVFNLTADSVAVYPSTPASLIISLGGTIQAPNTAYTVSGGQITFASAPATNTVFFGVSLGDTLDIGTPSDDSVNSQHYVDGSIDNVHLATGIDAVKLADGSVTNTEFQYINTLSSNAQTQITAKAPIASPTFTTGATSPSFITGNSGTIKLMDANGSNFASIAAHATTTADIAYTWPPAGPGTSGFALTATTAGVMSWAAAGTTISTNADNRIITGSDTANTLNGETNLMYDGNVLHVKNAGTASSIQLHCEVSNIHYVALKSPAHSTFTGGSWTLTLPGIDGTSGQFLQTNGSGVTSWAAAASSLTPWTENIDADTFTLTDVGATGNTWNSTALTVQSTTNAKLRIVIGSGDASIVFEGPTNWAVGLDNSASDQFVIGNNTALGGADKLTIATGGDVTVSVGNLVIGTNGKGIDFSATANSSGSSTDSELLNDYEEGHWVPSLSDGTNTATGQIVDGHYTKIGRMVNIQAYVKIINLGSVSGAIRINSLPFTTSSHGNLMPISVTNASDMNISAGQVIVGATVAGQSYFNIQLWDTALGDTPMQASEWTGSGQMTFGGWYMST